MTAKWQDWASFALGLWLALSPWIAGYAEQAGATANAVTAGLGSRARLALRMRGVREDLPVEWLNLGAGIWLVCAPLILDFASRVATANSDRGRRVHLRCSPHRRSRSTSESARSGIGRTSR